MENSMVRQRYTRRPSPARRRRRAPRAGGSSLQQIMARQLIICMVLLIMIGIVKNINISATNFVTDQVKYILNHNIELKNVFSYVDKLAADILKSIAPETTGKPASIDAQNAADTQNLTNNQPLSGTQTSSITPTSVAAPAIAFVKKGTEEVEIASDEDTLELPSSIENEVDHSSYAEEESTYLETAVLSASSDDASMQRSNMLVPVAGTLSSLYGEKTETVFGNGKTHNGIDINVVKGSSVKAALDGTVTAAGSSPSYGSYIRIKHTNGLETVYANCYSLIAKKDDRVKSGDIIASVGDIGTSVGAHLHFEVWKEGYAVNPLEYISVPAR